MKIKKSQAIGGCTRDILCTDLSDRRSMSLEGREPQKFEFDICTDGLFGEGASIQKAGHIGYQCL